MFERFKKWWPLVFKSTLEADRDRCIALVTCYQKLCDLQVAALEEKLRNTPGYVARQTDI